MDIYRRIYNLYKRNIPAQQISETVHISMESVRLILERFVSDEDDNQSPQDETVATERYLDWYTSQQHKVVDIELSGMLLEKQFNADIHAALTAAQGYAGSRFFVFYLSQITHIDKEGMEHLLHFQKTMASGGKHVFFFSPSDVVEKYIHQNNLENTIQIFGTKKTLEDFISDIKND